MKRLIISKYAMTYYNEIGVGSRFLHHPSYTSGVTIGCGYDLKHKSNEDIDKDLEFAKIERDTIDILKNATGLSKSEASDFCNKYDTLEITDAQQINLFKAISPYYEKIAIKDYEYMFKEVNVPSYIHLPEDIKDLIFDFTYNLGSIKTFPMFFKALLSGDRKACYANYLRYTNGKPLGRRNEDTKKILDGIMFRDLISS